MLQKNLDKDFKNDSKKSTSDVFLNGKALAIEMLQGLSRDERIKILKILKIKNPQLSDELAQQCFLFSDLDNLSDNELRFIFKHVSPPIVGMALKNVDVHFQRRLLSLADRDYAEKAYKVLTTSYSTEKKDIKRAQSKIIEVLSALKKSKK